MIEFETLSEKNIESVYELEKLCFDSPWTYKMFESEINNSRSVYLVAKDEQTDAIVGYIGVWLAVDFADITNVAVHPEYRKKGIAISLINEICRICKNYGIEQVGLEVNVNNKPAIALYKKLGFIVDSVRKKYYKNKDDAWLMSKKIIKVGD